MLTRNAKPRDRVDVRRRRVGRLLHRDAGAARSSPSRRRSPARSASCMIKFVIDGTLKKLGLNMEGRAAGRYADLYSPVRPFSAEERARVRGADAGDLRRVRREGGGRDATRRRRRSTRSGRGACGPAGRRSRSAWSTSSAGSSARSRSPSSARDSAGRRRGARRLPAAEVVLRDRGESVRPRGRRVDARSAARSARIRADCRR